MARRKKEGRRATGIQSKFGFLYVVISKQRLIDGEIVTKKEWVSTGLTDTPENVKKASEYRLKLIKRREISATDHNISLADYIDQILAKKQREIADTTYAAYLFRANCIKNFFTGYRVKEINTINVENFLDNLFINHNVQPRTVKDIKVFFSGVMEEAFKEGIISHNPVKEVVISKSLSAQYAKEKKTDDEFFSYEEAQQFLQKAESHELYELFYMTLFFGLRREEALGLRWSCIDFVNKTMTINHTVTKGTSVNRLNATKTDSSARQYPLTDDQVTMLLQIREKEDYYRTLFGNGYIDNDYIFKHADGSLYYPDYPTKAFNKIIKSSPDLPQSITFHGLRSSCVSILVHEGIDVKSIQRWVGHKDLDTTLRIYAKVKDKAAKNEISVNMSNIFQPKKYSLER